MGDPRDRLLQLLKRKENKSCADCHEPDPLWASVNWGVFICTQCAGVHRSLGVNNSFVLSCTLDDWTSEQVDNMSMNGNANVNEKMEYCVPKNIEVPYHSDTDRDTRANYIRAKYVDRLFCYSPSKTRRAPDRDPGRHRTSNPSLTAGNQVAMIEFIGIINVKLVECRALVIKDLVSSDPYCILSLGLQSHKSTVKYKNLDPVYNETFSFSWDGIQKLVVDVYDKDELSKDDDMGVVTVDLSPLLREKNAQFTGWYPIVNRKHTEREQGKMMLEVFYISLQNHG